MFKIVADNVFKVAVNELIYFPAWRHIPSWDKSSIVSRFGKEIIDLFERYGSEKWDFGSRRLVIVMLSNPSRQSFLAGYILYDRVSGDILSVDVSRVYIGEDEIHLLESHGDLYHSSSRKKILDVNDAVFILFFIMLLRDLAMRGRFDLISRAVGGRWLDYIEVGGEWFRSSYEYMKILGFLYRGLGEKFIDEVANNPSILDLDSRLFVGGEDFVVLRGNNVILRRGSDLLIIYNTYRSEIIELRRSEHPELFKILTALIDASRDLMRNMVRYDYSDEISSAKIRTSSGEATVVLISNVPQILRVSGGPSSVDLIKDIFLIECRERCFIYDIWRSFINYLSAVHMNRTATVLRYEIGEDNLPEFMEKSLIIDAIINRDRYPRQFVNIALKKHMSEKTFIIEVA
ncbi:MAG: hypothetical protein C0179_05520 [Fervidicoccus sp.]|nr:MAG: hypothetical protein C0179_05520 [Fervidicoccus sp.]